MYSIDRLEYQELEEWWSLFQQPQFQSRFGDNRDKLGKAIEAAGTYYESSHKQTENIRRLIDLSITLEAIFSPYNQNEISFQLSQLAGQFIGESSTEKETIYNDIKKIYGKRCSLFHGSHKINDEDFVTTDEIENFASIMRRALIRFITLYLRGEDDHKAIIKRIRQSLFDPKLRRKLKKDSDINLLINESRNAIS